MRSRFVLFTLSLYLAIAVMGCNKPPASDNDASNASNPADQSTNAGGEKESREAKEHREHREAKPIVVPAGTAITVSLGSAIGSKLSQPGQTFAGSVARDVVVGNEVVIPQGTNATGTVTDAKALGKFAGGAVLQVRLDSINLRGADIPVQASTRSFSQKGKGKRTAIIAGGGAALGGLIGGLAGGGKGAAIGLAAGGGAGAGGAAFTGNKEIVLPAESDITFELSQPLELRK
jgi:outer membrane lipoprotein SlyB